MFTEPAARMGGHQEKAREMGVRKGADFTQGESVREIRATGEF